MKKRILALIMAATLTLGMSMTTFAAESKETHSIVINERENVAEKHTYLAYQIFKGDYSKEKNVFSNVTWGENIEANTEVEYKGNKYNTAEDLAVAISKETDARDFSLAIVNYLKGEPVSKLTESAPGKGVTFDGLEDGYYLIMDEAGSLSGDNDSYTRYIVELVGNDVKVNAKSDVPSVDKKVKDKNDSANTETDWQESADYDVNDVISYQFTSTIVDAIDKYVEPYIYTFHDTMSEGLTFIGDVSVKVINGNEEKTIGFETKTNDLKDGCAFEVVTEDLRQVAKTGDTVVVEYKCKINENAVIGEQGNSNKVRLEFSNNPNGKGTGITPEDEVLVFTYSLVVNKIDADTKAPLEGATFKLYKQDSALSANERLSDDDFIAAELGDDISNNNYYLVTEIKTKRIDLGDDKFTYTSAFERVDDGDYVLVESETPDGYNTMKPLKLTISATHDTNLEDLSIDLGTFKADKKNGTLTSDIENKTGSLLPSTGGIGTTIFYIIGGLLVIGASVILFTKKKMANEQ